MNDFDFDHLGDVWRQPPDRAELEALMRSAEAVRHRARWGHLIDLASALVVAAVVLFLALLNPERDTLVVAGGAILLLTYSQYRQRRLRQEELRSLTGTAEEMLDQSIARAEARVRRIRFSLGALPAGLFVGLIFSYFVDDRVAGDLVRRFSSGAGVGTIILAVTGVGLAFAVYSLAQAIRRGNLELAKLKALRDAYRAERAQE